MILRLLSINKKQTYLCLCISFPLCYCIPLGPTVIYAAPSGFFATSGHHHVRCPQLVVRGQKIVLYCNSDT
jgi:hypothetical protein